MSKRKPGNSSEPRVEVACPVCKGTRFVSASMGRLVARVGCCCPRCGQKKAGRRGVGNGNRAARPDAPTDAPAGSVEKILVMAMRAERGQGLFHPLDPAHEPPPSPVEIQMYRHGRRREWHERYETDHQAA